MQWDPVKRLTVSTQPSELLECHLIWISDHVSCCKGNLLDMRAGIYSAFTEKSVPDSCLCAPKSAASGIFVLGMKGWIMERMPWSVTGLLIRSRREAELLESLTGMISLLNYHSAQQRIGDGSSLL